MTDGKALILIDPEKKARHGVRLYADSWEQSLSQLRPNHQIKEIDGVHVLADPNGVKVYLHEGPSPVEDFQAQDCFGIPGNFAGISLETSEFERSSKFWQALGFQQSSGGLEQGWCGMTNGEDFGISLMVAGSCPHLVFNPSLTYFNGGKNLPVIAAIKDAGIPITEEITHFNDKGIVDNIIIRDPAGYGFYIFND